MHQMRWSPEQISGWLSEQGIKLSHERIYQMIWDDKREGGNLWRCLRRRGKRYNKRAGKNAGRGLIPNRMTFPSVRPLSRVRPVWETGRATPSSAPGTKAACSRWSSAKPNCPKSPSCPCNRPRNTEGSRASPQAYRQLRAHHHVRQRKGVCRASGHRPCPESQNLLRHTVSRMGAWFE